MAKYGCRTRGNADYQEKPNYYFACYPEDFDMFFEDLSGKILHIQDCVIWYEIEHDAPYERRELEAYLSGMQLVFIPVTAKLLTLSNRAMEVEIPIAQSKHIPIIPIIMEAGLEDIFANRFGDIGYIDMTNSDDNDLRFEDELQLAISKVHTRSTGSLIGEGGYVFLSHSHDDIKIVRRFRNILEDNGMEPLCFYLKCLNDDAEVFDLIKREIDVRKQFVFVESENSRKSKWVRKEREYVTQCANKIIHRVSADDILFSLEETAQRILFSLRVYISYRKRDYIKMKVIADELIKQDFQVFYDDFVMPGEFFSDVIADRIEQACRYGAFIILLTEASLEISYQMTCEYPLAVNYGGLIIPVWVGESPWESVRDEFASKYLWLDSLQVIDSDGNPFKAVNKIVDTIIKHDRLI